MDQWIEQPFYSYQYYWMWMMNWFFTIFNIHLHFESAIFHPLIEWVSEWMSGLCDIEEYDILSKYRIVKPRLILLRTTTIKYQTHPIWFHYYQIDKSMFCDSLINKQTHKQMIVGLIEWWIQYDFQCYSIGFYSIIFYCSFISLLYTFHLYLIIYYVYSDRFLFNKSKSIS